MGVQRPPDVRDPRRGSSRPPASSPAARLRALIMPNRGSSPRSSPRRPARRSSHRSPSRNRLRTPSSRDSPGLSTNKGGSGRPESLTPTPHFCLKCETRGTSSPPFGDSLLLPSGHVPPEHSAFRTLPVPGGEALGQPREMFGLLRRSLLPTPRIGPSGLR